MDDTHISTVRIESLIFTLRGKKVIMDSKLAELYGVETKRLGQVPRRVYAKLLFAIARNTSKNRHRDRKNKIKSVSKKRIIIQYGNKTKKEN